MKLQLTNCDYHKLIEINDKLIYVFNKDNKIHKSKFLFNLNNILIFTR